jgi:oxygen-independent coproporphyrinogen-3 oxidase
MFIFDRELIEKCQINAPRYTSYPTADRFNFEYNVDTHSQELQLLHSKLVADPNKMLNQLNKMLNEMLSLYIHIPFCNTLCLYCGCNKVITNDRSNIAAYLIYLEKEMDLYYQVIQCKPKVVQLHFGGGSPSWLSTSEVDQVMELVRRYFDLTAAHEIAMEIDPRHVDATFIAALHKNGFNRISIGVQDFNPSTQKAVNRVQSYDESKLILDAATSLGFKSTNIDLIYGLPLQTVESFAITIDLVIKLNPARIALFNYAHIPSLFMSQTRIKDADLPTGSVKLDILQMSVDKLAKAGYVFIGMDHFARPNDELALALNDGTLQRNFQGYSTFANYNMLSFGVSSIGLMGDGYRRRSYYQNVKDLATYYQMLDNNQFPILRGLKLTDDDLIRSQVIQNIMCQFKLDYADIEQIYQIDFIAYFKPELIRLEELQSLGLIDIASNGANGFSVTDKGRFLVRNVAMVFDQYITNSLSGNVVAGKYSKVI